jgi:hypothetical protein
MPLLAASFESLLVFVVILLLSAVANWIKTRKGLGPETWDEDGTPAPPLPPRHRPPAGEAPPTRPKPVFDLEGELRRLFGEEPEPRPAPPPVLPRPVTESHPAEVFVPVVLAPTPPPARTRAAREAAGEPSRMASAATAFLRSGGMDRTGLDRAEAARLAAQFEHRAGSARDRRRAESTDVAAVLALLHQPATARQAILASVILSPPKALET